MSKLSDQERTQYRGWAVDYAIRINTKRNKFCGVESCAPSEKVLSDAQRVYDFMTGGAEMASLQKIDGGKK